VVESEDVAEHDHRLDTDEHRERGLQLFDLVGGELGGERSEGFVEQICTAGSCWQSRVPLPRST
jgi:hypothetical protein